ncbi:Aspartyl protease AED3 [Glycine soja]|uniref:Aspartyl protease AED3 n=1 Tax=Glycine soja TaxID=3848 RepID=A0A445H7D8_GLYSO|nr:Aspartyl protease AED3 [Glycine soja]
MCLMVRTMPQIEQGSTFSATLVQDSLRLGIDTLPSYAFRCVNSASGWTLPAQAQAYWAWAKGPCHSLPNPPDSTPALIFSYCLPSFQSSYFSGSLKLGPTGQPRRIRTTPLLRNPRRPSLYYVNLTGINVGRVRVSLPTDYLAFDPNKGSGTIIDSGTVITRFVGPVYNAIRDEFRYQVKGPFFIRGGFDTCFVKTYENLPYENTLIHTAYGGMACLAMAAAPNNVNSALTNFQQQNLRVLFDTVNNRVGIARELCN